jgi:glutamyl-tRNA reductase
MAAGARLAVETLEGVLAARAGVTADQFQRHAIRLEGREAAFHLFRVASSLDSMVVGEAQILGQLKDAWALAQESGAAGPTLHRVVPRAFRAAKRVRTDTAIAEGGVSISFVAVQLARKIFDDLRDCRVLLLGAGEMAELAAVHLAEQGVRSLKVANRTLERALRIAGPRGWEASSLDDLETLLRDADIVVSSTGSATPVIRVPVVKAALKRRGYRPLFLIDIAVPRDIERDTAALDGVYLYNIDDLEAVAATNRTQRHAEAARAERIVAEEADKLALAMGAQATSPTIAALRQRLFELRDAELARSERALRGLEPAQREAVERLTEAMIAKIMATPIAKVKAKAQTPDGDDLCTALRTLFDLPDLSILGSDDEAEVLADEENTRSGT